MHTVSVSQQKERDTAQQVREHQLKIVEARRRLAELRHKLAARRWNTGIVAHKWAVSIPKQARWP